MSRTIASGRFRALLGAFCVLVVLQGRLGTAAADEFQSPDWTTLPTPSAYNLTPSCPPTAENYFQCEVPASAMPPPDPSNPERYLNSAYWPAEKRPDIEIYAIQRYGYEYQNCRAHLPHYCFLLDAEAVGYPVDHTPVAGDLWLAPCEALTWMNGYSDPGCGGNDWYLGYVDEVFADGSFIQSWGGSTTPADSGLSVTWFSGSMDPSTYFIHLLPPGSPAPPKSPSPTHSHPHPRLRHPHLRLKARGKRIEIEPDPVLIGHQVRLNLTRWQHYCWLEPGPPNGHLVRYCSERKIGKPKKSQIKLKEHTMLRLPGLGHGQLYHLLARTRPFKMGQQSYAAAHARITFR